MSAFSNVESVPPQRVWEGVRARSVHGERVTLGLIELEPGSAVPEHSHDNEQVGILVEGSLSFRIGGERGDVRPGGTWCIPPGVPHEVVAGPEGAVLVEVFSPPRADWASLELLEPAGPWP